MTPAHGRSGQVGRYSPLLLVLLAAFAFPSLAHAWTPGTFVPYCGTSAFDDANRNGDRDPFLATPAMYAGATEDPDTPADDPCPDIPHVAWVSQGLADGLARLSLYPFPESPSPSRLGPVFRDPDTGADYVRWYVELDNDTVAGTLINCLRPPTADTLGIIGYGGRITTFSRLSARYTAIHELVHVLQGAQTIEAEECAQGGALLPEWWSEGTADALATQWIREEFPGFAPAPTTGVGRNLMGLRPYDVSLAAPSQNGGLNDLPEYRASSLFRFIAERWHDGDHGIWAESMGRAAPGGGDGLAWLDAVLRDPAFGVGHPFALVYPSFLASYASWGHPDSTRWPHVGDDAWRNIAFGECTRVVLTPEAPAETRSIRIESLAAECVEVVVAGLNAGQVASVEVLARGPDNASVDDLHLGIIELGLEPIDGGPRTCLELERATPGGLPPCTLTPSTAEYSGPYFRPNVVRTFQSSKVQANGDSWTDRMVLVRAPAEPTDTRHGNRNRKTYDVTFALQTANARVEGTDLGPVRFAPNLIYNDMGLPVASSGSGDLSRVLFSSAGPPALGRAVAEQTGVQA